jgi:hypothetical protein
VIEDDMEVSPFFYRWTKLAIQTYHANKRNYSPRLYGISLQQQGYNSCPSQRSLGLPVHTNFAPYFYPMVGSWGTLLFPKPWEQFLHWYRQRKTETPDFKPYIKDNIFSHWLQARPFSFF